MTPNCGPLKSQGGGLGAQDGGAGLLKLSSRRPKTVGGSGNCRAVCRALCSGESKEEFNPALNSESNDESPFMAYESLAGIVVSGACDDASSAAKSCCNDDCCCRNEYEERGPVIEVGAFFPKLEKAFSLGWLLKISVKIPAKGSVRADRAASPSPPFTKTFAQLESSAAICSVIRLFVLVFRANALFVG